MESGIKKFTKEDTKIIKGVALCLMLYHHLFAYPDRLGEGIGFLSLYSFGETTLSTYIGQFGRICVPTFLFLSGYGTYLSSGNNNELRTMCAQRVRRLYIQMWQVFFLSLPVSLWVNRYKGTALIGESILNGLSLQCSFNEEWWFILPFAVLLVLFPALKKFLDRKNANIYTDFLFVLLYSAFYNYIVPGILSLPSLAGFDKTEGWHRMNETLSIFPAFFLGCVFAKYGILDRIKAEYAGRPVWCIVSVIGIGATFYLRLYNHMHYDFVNSAVFVMCLTVLTPLSIFKWPSRFFAKLSEESTFIWLTHSFFTYYWCQRLVFAPKYSLLIFAFLVVLSWCAAKFIRFFWKTVLELRTKVRSSGIGEKHG